jgi:hypothetical protein
MSACSLAYFLRRFCVWDIADEYMMRSTAICAWSLWITFRVSMTFFRADKTPALFLHGFLPFLYPKMAFVTPMGCGETEHARWSSAVGSSVCSWFRLSLASSSESGCGWPVLIVSLVLCPTSTEISIGYTMDVRADPVGCPSWTSYGCLKDILMSSPVDVQLGISMDVPKTDVFGIS